MKTQILAAVLLSFMSVEVFAASIQEVRDIIDSEITRIEEEKGLVCIDTEKFFAMRGALDRHSEGVQYACRTPEVGSKVVYIHLTMTDKKIRPFKQGPIEDYTLSKIIIPSERTH